MKKTKQCTCTTEKSQIYCPIHGIFTDEASAQDYPKMMSDKELHTKYDENISRDYAECHEGFGGEKFKKEFGEMESTYYISVDGGSAPSISHDDADTAIEEAKRLSGKTGKVVRVLRQIATVKREESFNIEFYD